MDHLEAHHGGIDYREIRTLNIDPDSILDFSTNVLPLELPKEARHFLVDLRLDRYPDRDSLELRRVLSERWQLSRDQLLVGNGSSELIHAIASAYLSCDDVVLVESPSFSEYARSSRLMNANVVSLEQPPDQKEDYLRFWIDAIGSQRTRLVWICNPNNPTGRYVDSEWILELAREHPDVLFVVDEAYMDFVEHGSSLLSWGSSNVPENLFVLRSLTKFQALAGIRLGYLFAHELHIARLIARRVPWTVNAIAQTLGVYVLTNPDYYTDAFANLRRASIELRESMRELGFPVKPSDVSFFLMQVGNATEFRRFLLGEGLLVRDCHSFGLSNMVRISPRFGPDNKRLIDAVRRIPT